MPPRSNPLTPDYRWNPTAGRAHEGRYISANGRIVSRGDVREALDRTIDRAATNIDTLANKLRAHEISLADWQLAMKREILDSQLAAAAAAKGGWAQMTQADYGRVGGLTGYQYIKLDAFANEIEAGTQKLDGRFVMRADMYGEASRAMYHRVERLEMEKRGFTLERNVLGNADHCDDCLEETAREWVSIGELIPVGMRQCVTNCKCTIAYATGDEQDGV